MGRLLDNIKDGCRRMILGLDLDGCSYPFVDMLRTWICQQTGRDVVVYPPAVQWDFFVSQWGITMEEYKQHVADAVRGGFMFYQGEPEEGAVEVINELYKEHEIHITTSRFFPGVEQECVDATKFWLARVGIPYHKLNVVNNKVELGLDLLLDDAPHNLETAIQYGERAVAFDRPWNSHVDICDRVYSWKNFAEYVGNLELV